MTSLLEEGSHSGKQMSLTLQGSFSHCVQVCSVEFDRKNINMNKLVATSLEGKFHVFDLRTQHATKGFASVSEKVTEGWRQPAGQKEDESSILWKSFYKLVMMELRFNS